MNKILILGSSGWIAHYLITSLRKHFDDCQFLGSCVSHRPEHDIDIFEADSSQIDIIEKKITSFSPTIVINMTRGPFADGITLNKYLIDSSNKLGFHYNFFSSFNALDANVETEHYEDELANASSEYGQYKASCEKELIKSAQNFSIFRFGATHGWAPNSKSRTELFLEKMLSGESMTVDTGVLQNRLATNHMTDMMAAVLLKKGDGVFHFGAQDGSEEIDFLRNLAESFGHPREQIIEGVNRPCNALMIPDRTIELIGSQYEKSEEETIFAVRHMIRLAQYIL